MAIDPTTAPPTFAPLVSQLSDAISRQLSDAFAEVQARADRERDEAVSSAVATQGQAMGRERDAQLAALDGQIRALRRDYDARLEAHAGRAREEREALETRFEAELASARATAPRDADDRAGDALAAAAFTTDAPDQQQMEPRATVVDGQTQGRIVERELALAASARLLTAFERLDAAHTVRETLDALVDGLAAEVARVLVFVMRGDDLRGWQFVGVEGELPDAATLSIRRDDAGPLTAALARGVAIEVHPSALAHAVPPVSWIGGEEGSEPMVGMAVPLVVDHQVVALAYCDDGLTQDRSVPAPWPEVVQVLVRHASRCLEAHTARRAAGFSRPVAVAVASSAGIDRAASQAAPTEAEIEAARRFARLVVSELKLYNESAVMAGREARDLNVRLRDELARARRLYEARVPASLPGRDAYFEQEVVRTLADGDATLLGDAATSAA